MLLTITCVSVLIVNSIVVGLVTAFGVGLYLRQKKQKETINRLRGIK